MKMWGGKSMKMLAIKRINKKYPNELNYPCQRQKSIIRKNNLIKVINKWKMIYHSKGKIHATPCRKYACNSLL